MRLTPGMGFGVSEPKKIYTVTYTYIDSLNKKGHDTNLKTLEMRAHTV